jgi:hypothetical protein
MDSKLLRIRLAAGLSLLSLSCFITAFADPVTLDDLLLDQITAGSEASTTSGSGGAIIGNSSEATISQTGGVSLEGEAQSGAKGLNIVNSAESTVANGVNVWDLSGDNVSNNGQLAVDQSNMVHQEQRRSASMPGYSRPEADKLVQIDRSGSETHNDSLDRNNNVVDIETVTNSLITTSTAWVDTTIAGSASTGGATDPKGSIDTNVGKGGAGAGNVTIDVDGGEAQIGLAVDGGADGDAQVLATEDIITEVDGNVNESYGGMTVDGGELALYGRLILPEIEITFQGAGCGVAMGSCGAGGTSNESRSEENDNSVMDNEKLTSVGNSEFQESRTNSYRSPFELQDAQAEYIVVDDSKLTVNTTFNLALTGSAQSNVSAMNVVNATGSAVANGINIARTSGLSGEGSMNLQQSNVISHSR